MGQTTCTAPCWSISLTNDLCVWSNDYLPAIVFKWLNRHWAGVGPPEPSEETAAGKVPAQPVSHHHGSVFWKSYQRHRTTRAESIITLKNEWKVVLTMSTHSFQKRKCFLKKHQNEWKANHISVFSLLFCLGGREERCVSLYLLLHVYVHRYSINAGPLYCLRFSRLCRKYLKNWLDTVWIHSTDLLRMWKYVILWQVLAVRLIKFIFSTQIFPFGISHEAGPMYLAHLIS